MPCKLPVLGLLHPVNVSPTAVQPPWLVVDHRRVQDGDWKFRKRSVKNLFTIIRNIQPELYVHRILHTPRASRANLGVSWWIQFNCERNLAGLCLFRCVWGRVLSAGCWWSLSTRVIYVSYRLSRIKCHKTCLLRNMRIWKIGDICESAHNWSRVAPTE